MGRGMFSETQYKHVYYFHVTTQVLVNWNWIKALSSVLFLETQSLSHSLTDFQSSNQLGSQYSSACQRNIDLSINNDSSMYVSMKDSELTATHGMDHA